MLSLISIDGMKREQSLIRIHELTFEITAAQNELKRFEQFVENSSINKARRGNAAGDTTNNNEATAED